MIRGKVLGLKAHSRNKKKKPKVSVVSYYIKRLKKKSK
jgi:hypothetical protein